MPSFLEKYLNELGGGLDEKAINSLKELNSVCALSILHRLHEKHDTIRSHSAFVATAARNARDQGVPGPKELEGAMARLSQDSTIDESAQTVLGGVKPQDACHAIAGFLTSDQASVRNPSAYITRNATNAKKQADGEWMPVGNIYGASGQGLAPMFQKWQRHLDEKAIAALEKVGWLATEEILWEMDSKSSSVRNPSAYVVTAVMNPKPMPSLKAVSWDPRSGADGLRKKWAPFLDDKANAALHGVGTEAASGILQELDKQSAVRNPSAWVSRACEKLPTIVTTPAVPVLTNGRALGRIESGLDQDAKNGLKEVSSEERAKILNELNAKGASVRNPSAYVIKAVENAKKHSAQEETGEQAALDEEANAALAEIATEAAEAILAELEAKGTKIRNPSAYVLRAVGNARKGVGAGGKAVSLDSAAYDYIEEEGPAMELVEKMEHLASVLDDKARQALYEVKPSSALIIIEAMNRQEVKNASAYIMKAIANERKKGSALIGSAKRVKR